MKLFISLLVLMVTWETIAQTKEQPNILWITFEDTSPHLIYDNPSSITPNMDRLEKEGVRFNAMFSTATICSPSRSAIITGLHASSIGTGNHRSNIPVPSSIKGFPYYLKEKGYHTSNNVKTDYNVRNQKAFIEECWTESSKNAHWRNRKDNQPFFSVFNLNESHASRTFVWKEEKYKEEIYNKLPKTLRTDEETLILPPFYRDSPDMRHHMARIYNCINYTDYRIGKILEQLKEDQLEDETIIFIFADHGEAMPRGKGNGINLGHRVPMYVYVPEKYKHLSGLTMGETTERVGSFEDLATTILSLVDLPQPAYLEGTNLLAEEYDKTYFYGHKDGADDARDITREISDGRFMYSRVYNTALPELQFKHYTGVAKIYETMREDLRNDLLNEDQKNIFIQKRDKEMLFDLQNDPWELRNLANDPAYTKQLKKFRKLCQNEILKTRDLQFIPYGEMMAMSKKHNMTPYEFKTDESIYPLKEMMSQINIAGEGEKFIEKQLKGLKSEHGLVRYWAAYGLKSQTSLQSDHYELIHELLKNETESYVQIELATILCINTPKHHAFSTLEKYALGSDYFDQWHALRNIFDYLPNQENYNGIYSKVIDQLPSKQKVGKKYKNIYFDVIETAKSGLYMNRWREQ
ncbi:sulfatase [Flammeovirga sp. EKP202]|uniref:sulfatase family protein n=1 Tax=Flammeovirga sp. EKP202 TaxID=2770592 RepID=UPI00165F03B6|nr:sulfatase [Flammeovirga sp. EKP202]MBD0402837.1 sulfatase [Flammeovirga sp. EKP202]